MATRLHLTASASDLNGTLGSGAQKLARRTIGDGATSYVTTTVAGPTAGVQVTDTAGGTAQEWYTEPLQAVTISGTITKVIWGNESATQANAGFHVQVHRTTNAGAVISTIHDSERGTEMSSANNVNTWTTGTVTSTTLATGDRLRIRVLINDAGGTMSQNRSATYRFNGAVAAADGNTYVEFTENFQPVVLPLQRTATLTLSEPTVTAAQGALVTPTQQTATLALAAPAVSAGSGPTVAAAVLAAGLTLGVPTVQTADPTTRRALVTWVAFETPSLGAQPAPGGLAISLSLSAPTIQTAGGTVVAPSQRTLTLTLPAPAVSATRRATIQPPQLVLTTTLAVPAVATGARVSPSQRTLAATLHQPTVSAGTGVTVAATLQTATLTPLAPTVTPARTISLSAAVLPATLSLFQPSVAAGGSVTAHPTRLDLVLTIAQPTLSIGGSATVQPVQRLLTLTQPPPTIVARRHLLVVVDVLAATLSTAVPTVTVGIGVTIQPDRSDLALVLHAPAVSTARSVAFAQSSVLVVALALHAPTITALGGMLPGTVQVGIFQVGGVSVGTWPPEDIMLIGDMIRFGNFSLAEDANGVAAEAFTNVEGAPTDPTTVTLTIQKPDATTLVYTWPSAGPNGVLARESAGRFYRDVVIDQSGRWTQSMAGTGNVTAAAQSRTRVSRSYIAA
jgi:hypothetical protein